MPVFSVAVDTVALTRWLDAVQRRQIPFASARALNAVGKLALADLREEMKRTLDRPTPFTLGAFGLKPATRDLLTATIAPRSPAAGRSAWTYLGPEVLGGPRAMKGFELKLSAFSAGQFVLPGSGVPLDSYGNVSQTVLSQVISGLTASPAPAPPRPSAAARGRQRAAARRGQFMVVRAGGKPDGRPIGIYRVNAGGSLAPMFTFTKSVPEYKVRLDVEATVARSVAAHWEGEFRRALDAALKTAR